MILPEGFSFEKLVQACRNIGYDLTCGHCATVFFTGVGVPGSHEPQCSTIRAGSPGRKIPRYLSRDEMKRLVSAMEQEPERDNETVTDAEARAAWNWVYDTFAM